MSEFSKKTAYLPFLDGLRALSILPVLAFHNKGPVSQFIFGEDGWIGVDYFFVFSGFLITSLLLQERKSFGHVNFRNFYIRRALRIFPAYYCFLVIFLISKTIHGHNVLTQFAVAATYMTDFGIAFWNIPQLGELLAHTWSLGVEEKFYFVWPAIVSVAGPWSALIAAVGILVSQICTGTVLLMNGSIYHLVMGIDCKSGSLMWGCLAAAWWFFDENRIRRILSWKGLPWTISLFLVGVMHNIGAATLNPTLWLVRLPLATFLLSVLILALLTHTNSTIATILSSPPMRWIGRLSYSLYLWHGMAFTITRFHGTKLFGSHTVMLEISEYTVAILFACLSFYIVEKPFLRVKTLFESGPTARLKNAPAKADEPAIPRHLQTSGRK